MSSLLFRNARSYKHVNIYYTDSTYILYVESVLDVLFTALNK